MRLSSVAFIVPDYASGITFFCETLGFELVCDIDQGRKRWVEVRAPGAATSVVIAQADGPAQSAMIGNQGAGRVWLFLHTDDFARDHARLTGHGIVFEDCPRH